MDEFKMKTLRRSGVRCPDLKRREAGALVRLQTQQRQEKPNLKKKKTQQRWLSK